MLVSQAWAKILRQAPFSSVYTVTNTRLILPNGEVAVEVIVPGDGACMYHCLWLAELMARLEAIGLEHIYIPAYYDNEEHSYDSDTTINLMGEESARADP